MTALLLHRILIGSMIGIVVAGGAGYYLLSGMLTQRVIEADHAKIDLDISRSNVDTLRNLDQQLKNNQDIIARAQDIVGTATDFKYQDQAINDLNQLAAANGVGITGYSFPSGASAPPQAGITLPAGVKSVLVTINTASPIAYQNYLRFLRALELNLTRFQITGVDVTPDGQKPDQITNSSIGIMMYVRG